MKVFRFSRTEYKQTYRAKFLSPDGYTGKKVIKLQRTGLDDKTCRLNIRGYPLRPKDLKHPDQATFKKLC